MRARGLVAWIALVVFPLWCSGQSATSRAVLRPGTAEGGWREFRGDALNTGVSHGPAPAIKAIRWKFLADSEVTTSPAVADGMVYFGSWGGYVYAVRASDGSKIWERLHTTRTGDGQPLRGFTYSSPAIVGERLLIGSEDGHLYCIATKTGDLLWKKHLGGTADTARIWSSPKSDGRRVFVGSHAGHFWAIDVESGKDIWKTWIGDEIGGSAAFLGPDVLVAARDKRMYVIDGATGAIRWRVELGGVSMSTPAIAFGCAFVRAGGGRAVCVDLANQSVRWTTVITTTTHAVTAMAHDGDHAFVTNAGTLAAVDAQGQIVWKVTGRAAIEASPTVVGPLVIVAGTDETLTAVDRKTGERVAHLHIGEKMLGTPAIVGGVVYAVGMSGTVFAVE